ncbi:MAG: ParB/RepB/Spo0J family partition protein [Thermomicrobiales bacterium]
MSAYTRHQCWEGVMVRRDDESATETGQGGRPAAPRKGGLGRGLGALIPTLDAPRATPSTLDVDINAFEPNPYQPRTMLDSAALDALAASIRAHGIIQPLVVTAGVEQGRYIIIAGERRWRAARIAGLTSVPVVVKDAAPRAMLELALVENVVRADLSPLEEAAAYRQLIDDFGLTQAAVAERVGRSRVSVTNTLRLLGLPDAVLDALAAAEITEGHARALLGLPAAPDQVAALEQVVQRGLSVRQTEELVRRWAERDPNPAPDSGRVRPVDPNLQSAVTRFERALGTRVSLKPGKSGGGALTIHYGSDEELDAIYRRFVSEDEW